MCAWWRWGTDAGQNVPINLNLFLNRVTHEKQSSLLLETFLWSENTVSGATTPGECLMIYEPRRCVSHEECCSRKVRSEMRRPATLKIEQSGWLPVSYNYSSITGLSQATIKSTLPRRRRVDEIINEPLPGR